MYRDLVQWSGIQRRILREGVSISQVVRETGISRKSVRKMLKHPLPKPGQGAVLLETRDWDGLSERVMVASYSASRSLRTAAI